MEIKPVAISSIRNERKYKVTFLLPHPANHRYTEVKKTKLVNKRELELIKLANEDGVHAGSSNPYC